MIARLLQCLLQYEPLLREGRFEALSGPPFPPSFGVAHNYPFQTIFWSSLSGAGMDAHKEGSHLWKGGTSRAITPASVTPLLQSGVILQASGAAREAGH